MKVGKFSFSRKYNLGDFEFVEVHAWYDGEERVSSINMANNAVADFKVIDTIVQQYADSCAERRMAMRLKMQKKFEKMGKDVVFDEEVDD